MQILPWQSRKAWSDRFLPQIKRILGTCLIDVANAEEDALRNTDLMTLRLPGAVRIACRVRRHAYLAQYADEFTLRCSVPSGRETEIDKMLAGWGEYLMYGFANREETGLATWLVGDLSVFRDWVSRYRHQFGRWPGTLRSNADGSSSFMAFRIDDVDRHFVVARSGPADKETRMGSDQDEHRCDGCTRHVNDDQSCADCGKCQVCCRCCAGEG